MIRIHDYVLYETDTGKIVGCGASSSPEKQVASGQNFLIIPEDPKTKMNGWKVDLDTLTLAPDTPRTNEVDLARAVRAGATDQEIDEIIERLDGIDDSVQQYRLKNFRLLRMCLYPPIEEFIDAQVKLNHPDPEIHIDGRNQLKNYVSACLAVKARFQKPDDQENKGGSRGGV